LSKLSLKYKFTVFFLLLFLEFVFTIDISAQYTFDWAKTYGGDAWDEAFGLVETAKGDLVLCGYTKAQEKHLWIIKLDEYGNSIWGKTYKAKPVSEAKDIIIARDSNIVVAGYSIKPYSYQSDLWIVKLNQQGEKLWDKNYGGVAEECANSITEAYDGGYVMAGVTSTTKDFQDDAWVIKVDSTGEKLWERTFGGSKPDYANDIIETKDKSLVVCGMTSSRGEGYKSFWVAKMDSSGTDIWDNIYRINQWDEATAVVEGLDGYLYVTGYTRTYSVIDYDVVLLKIDKDGNLIWQKVFSWGIWDQATSICNTFDNGVVVGGFSKSGKVLLSSFAVTKFDGDGNNLWQNIFVRKSLDYSNKIIETRDNGLAMAGTTYMQGMGWDYALLKFKNNDLPQISFYQDSITTSINENYTIHSCISSKSNLKNIQVFFNDSLLVNNARRKSNPVTTGCDIPLDTELKLLKGINKVELVITDYKNHQIKNSCKIYFIPPSQENW
jgi:hypothetical protein